MVAHLHLCLGHGDKKINGYGRVRIEVDKNVKRLIDQSFYILDGLMVPIQIAFTKEIRFELSHVPEGRQFFFHIEIS